MWLGKVTPIGGTSLAGPMVAAVLALLNARQVASASFIFFSPLQLP
jgi:hypothetical protein